MVTAAFVATSAMVLLMPGPTNTMLAASGATLGWRKAALLPIAEAMGYAVAISIFALFASIAKNDAAAMTALRLVAAVWLLHTALHLWRTPFASATTRPREAFARVFVTTLLNPKAMLVGTVLIPADAAMTGLWIATFVSLSTLAGYVWMLAGSLVPFGLRRHAYKATSVILGGFSIAAAAGAFVQGV
jgi:threonine/homoserine/homoserine lactone efflux protein